MSDFHTLGQNRSPADAGVRADRALFGQDAAQPSDCAVGLYDTTPGLLALATRFLRDGVARGERCLYLHDDSTPRAVTDALADQGVDVVRAMGRRALVFVSARGFGAAGSCDTERLIAYLDSWAADTGSHIFTGVRIAAEMTWAHRTPDLDGALIAFDSLFDAGSGRRPLTGAAIYHYGQFGQPTLRRVIRGHRHVNAPDHIYLRLSPMLQGLTDDARTAFLNAAGERFVSKGRFFFNQGDEAAQIFLLTRGRVASSRIDRNGQRVAMLEIATPSDVFGDNALLAGAPRAASAVALDNARALVWDVGTFRRTIAAHPDTATGAIEHFIRRHRSQWQDLRILATERVEQRLARVLWRLVDAAGRRTLRGAVIEVALSGQDLAEMAATTPYTISRIFATWRRQHIVDARRNHMRILDARRLTSIAQSDAEAEPSVS